MEPRRKQAWEEQIHSFKNKIVNAPLEAELLLADFPASTPTHNALTDLLNNLRSLTGEVESDFKKFNIKEPDEKEKAAVLHKHIGLLDAATESAKAALAIIKKENSSYTSRMQDIINRIEESKKYRLGKDLPPRKLNELINEIQASNAAASNDKKNEINVSIIPPELKVALITGGSGSIVADIIENCLGNSNRFTENGKIDITVSNKDGSLEIKIQDNGPGMPSEVKNKVIQGEKVTVGGHGIGLAGLSRLIKEEYKGTMEVKSSTDERDHGTTFIWKLPVEKVIEKQKEKTVAPSDSGLFGHKKHKVKKKAPAKQEKKEETVSPYKIYVIDDNEINAKMLKRIVEMQAKRFCPGHFEVVKFSSAAEAENAFNKGKEKNEYVVALLVDKNMPLDFKEPCEYNDNSVAGYELINRIRIHEKETKENRRTIYLYSGDTIEKSPKMKIGGQDQDVDLIDGQYSKAGKIEIVGEFLKKAEETRDLVIKEQTLKPPGYLPT